MVVAYHAGGILRSGFIGVDVFFVISGYVISASVMSRVEAGQFSLTSFFAHRIRRILPALAVVLATIIGLSTWLSPISSRLQTVRTGGFAAVGAANAFLYRFRPDGYFSLSEKTNALLHTWSLSLEEQFYFLFAIVVFVIVRAGNQSSSRRRLRHISVPVGLLSLILCILASHPGVAIPTTIIRRLLGSDVLDASFAFYMPITRAWEFLAGVLIGTSTGKTLRVNRKVLASSSVLMLAVATFSTPLNTFPGIWSLLPVAATSLLIYSQSFGELVTGRVGVILEWIGDRSYSWYLWHWPLLQFAAPFNASRLFLGSIAVASIVPAYLSYRFIEQPLRTNPRWRPPIRTALIGIACIALPLVALTTAHNPEPDLENHLDVTLGCVYGDLSRLQIGGSCILPASTSRGIAALIGDSHASHLSEAFVIAARDLNLDAMLASRASTPFLYLESLTVDGTNELPRQMIEHLIAQDVAVVVIAQSNYALRFLENKTWADGMRPVLQQLEAAGIPAVLVAQSVTVDVDPQACSHLQMRVGVCPADVVRDTAQLRSDRDRFSSEVELATSIEGVVLLDTFEYLCPSRQCATKRDGHWWWRDSGHISIYASSHLSLPLRDAMRRALVARAT
jgi:peptidoglycan/LPS O-acetylase OafA/YrhL